MSSPGLESDRIEPISLDHDAELAFVLEQVRASLSAHVDRAVAAAGPAQSRKPGFRHAVEEAVMSRFLSSITTVIQQNVSIAGRRPGEAADDVSAQVEPYDETLNRNVMAYADQVDQLILDVTQKRKAAPPKAAAQVERALAHARQTAADRAQAEDWPEPGPLELVNADMVYGAAGRKDLQESATMLSRLAAAMQRSTLDAERAVEVAEDVRQLQKPAR